MSEPGVVERRYSTLGCALMYFLRTHASLLPLWFMYGALGMVGRGVDRAELHRLGCG